MAEMKVNRVALVTGGGRGLGRSHALALARRGMSVVVNDSGVELDGTGGSPEPAEGVAAEVRALGGSAVVSTDDVSTHAGAQAAVARALEEFGQLDVLVNNAGCLRDRSFAKANDEDFDYVLRTHLGGTAYCTRAAWSALQDSGSGRVVFTSSASGLYGQFGQANYAAAKAGIVGLLNVLKLEGARHGICVNAIAPVARTRMTESLLTSDVVAGLDPELVSPVVAFLASAGCTRTGLVLEVGAGLLAQVRVVESPTVDLSADDDDAAVDALLTKLADLGLGEDYPSSAQALERVTAAAAARGR
jgi:NAD(P)-dependent dehydrogenase (short-subunit alcohol dehydrogenase family)